MTIFTRKGPLMKRQFELRVTGRVQGVGFRYSAREQARALGLNGWVENLSDGSVRAVIQGEEEACHLFIRWCRKGPGFSWVERVDVTEKSLSAMKPFSVRH
jgi:acylphosphatase